MATRCFTPILGKRIRTTALDSCGNVPEAAAEDSVVVTDGFISVTLSAEVEEGTEILTKKADGSICVNELGDSSFKRFNVEMELCGVDPGLLSVISNAETYEDWNSDIAGIVVPEGTLTKRFSFELWTGLAAAACGVGEEASGYLLLPFVAGGVIGDIEVTGEDAVTFSVTGASTRGGNNWGVGPFPVLLAPGEEPEDDPVPAPLPTALDPLDHLLLIETALAPPPSACGAVAMPSFP